MELPDELPDPSDGDAVFNLVEHILATEDLHKYASPLLHAMLEVPYQEKKAIEAGSSASDTAKMGLEHLIDMEAGNELAHVFRVLSAACLMGGPREEYAMRLFMRSLQIGVRAQQIYNARPLTIPED